MLFALPVFVKEVQSKMKQMKSRNIKKDTEQKIAYFLSINVGKILPSNSVHKTWRTSFLGIFYDLAHKLQHKSEIDSTLLFFSFLETWALF